MSRDRQIRRVPVTNRPSPDRGHRSSTVTEDREREQREAIKALQERARERQ